MVEKNKTLIQGGIYLAKLNPAKVREVGKVRPVAILTAQEFLELPDLPIVFICPLSSHSESAFQALHLALPARDQLEVKSYALVEHCRAIGAQRIIQPRLAQLSLKELQQIQHRLQRLLGN